MHRFAPGLAVALLCGLAFPSPSIATDAGAAAAAPVKIPGYLDPTTGIFTVMPLVVPATAVARNGKLIVTTNVTIDPSIALDQTITCSVSASSFDSSFSNNASSQETVVKISTGLSGKCVNTIPYIWDVASATTNMTVSVSISAGNGYSTGSVSHSASSSFAPFAVPNGTKSITLNLAL